MNKIPIGVKGVDSILPGGFPQGKCILLSGSCGTGKTIFAAHFINEGFRNREPGIFVSLEQDKSKLFCDLKEINIEWKKMEETGKLRMLGGSIAAIQRLKEQRKAGFEDFAQEIRDVALEIGAKRVVIDSLNLFLSLFEFPEQRRALVELIYVLQETGCTVLLTCETREQDKGLSWYGFEEYVADGVVLLKRTADEHQGRDGPRRNKRALEVIKMRGSDFKEGNFPLRITNKGMEVYMTDLDREFFHS